MTQGFCFQFEIQNPMPTFMCRGGLIEVDQGEIIMLNLIHGKANFFLDGD